MKIGSKEKALIHVAKAQLGLDDDRYRDLLRSTCGVESSKNMDYNQYDKLIKRFRELGFKLVLKTNPEKKHLQPSLKATDRDPDAIPSPALTYKISSLYAELGWTGERQMGFNNRVIKKPWPQTRTEANKIIEGLKAMIARADKRV
jgi:hypothetical protein